MVLLSPGIEYMAWLKKKRICLMMGLPYRLASNGAAERVVQTVKGKLKKSHAGNFRTQVARVLFQYRTTAHDITGSAPGEPLLGQMVKTPLDVLHPDLRSTALLKQKLAADRGFHSVPSPKSGAPVFARNFRPGPPWSVGQVVSPGSASSLLVPMPDGTTWHRQADHVRPRLGTWLAPSTTTSQVQPAGGPTATPVTTSEAQPTSKAASIANWAASVVPV
ncbi:uncharacterized protein [Dermacentor albipictus]|uniref:uncharacterized protein n=1 Tax=Dermacentor albipictus TaxID=60249 RepID=UPI0038FC652A